MNHIKFPTIFFLMFALLQHTKANFPTFTISSRAWEERTCTVNVCFGIDGSDVISSRAFNHELGIVKAISKALSIGHGSPQFAGIQYGLSSHPISPLTSDHTDFIRKISATEQFREPGSFLTGGLNYCFSALQDAPAGSKKIVILGNGRNTIGSDPGPRADLFYSSGGEVYAVGVGDDQNKETLLNIAGGDPGKFFEVDDWRAVWRVANQLSNALCT